jgi:hypothetical protein
VSRCTARANRTGQQCQKRAIKGASVCLSHGAAASQVRRVAAQRIALTRAAELLGPDTPAVDPGQVLLEAVKAAASLLEGAEAAVRAEEPDADALHALGEAAMTAGRLARLALDAGVEQRLTRQAERNGELVGTLLVRVLEGLELGPETTARAFNLIRGEIDYGDLTLGQLDEEIRRIAEELRQSDYADAARGFPAKLARGLNAGFAVLDLDDDQRERVTVAVESFLQHEAEESARLAEETKPKPPDPARPWWTDSPRYQRNGNGNGNGRR